MGAGSCYIGSWILSHGSPSSCKGLLLFGLSESSGGGGIQSQPKWGLDKAMPVAIYEFSRSSQSLKFQNKQTNNNREIICQ